MSYYQNQELAPFDAAFQQQIGQMAMTGQIPNNIARAISQQWQNQKQNILQNTKYQYQNLGGYNNNIIAGVVSQFIRTAAQSLVQNQMAMQQAYSMPFYGTPQPQYMQQPAMNVGFGNNFSAVSFPVMQNAQTTQQPMYNEATPKQQTTVQTESQQTTQQSAKPQSSFTAPAIDEADSLYGDKVLSTSKGTLQVTSWRDSYGQSVKYVKVKLIDACFNDDEAIIWAKRLYSKESRYHIDIEYPKLEKLSVPYAIFSQFIEECRKFVTGSSSEKGDLKYLQGIQKLLNKHQRGVADEIDGYLCNRFNEIGGVACCRSTDSDGSALTISKFSALIELSNRDSANEVVQQWYKIPEFKEQFVQACNASIREFILNVTLVDPSISENIPLLMRANSGLVETDDLSLLDVTKELFPHRMEFANASMEEKMQNFGDAGKELMNSVVFLVGGHTVTLTKLIPEGIAGKSKNIPVLMMNNIIMGGYDENNKPCPVDSLFEYFMVFNTMESRLHTHVVIEYKQASVRYACSRCADGALLITTEK